MVWEIKKDKLYSTQDVIYLFCFKDEMQFSISEPCLDKMSKEELLHWFCHWLNTNGINLENQNDHTDHKCTPPASG